MPKPTPNTISDDDRELLARTLSVPSGYATVKLGMSLHPTQKAVLDSLFIDRKVSFLAANSTGKTSCVMVAAILYALEVLNAQVVSTSATFRQVTSQLIPNLKRYQHLYPNWEFNDNTIVINGIKRYIGFSAGDQGESAFQGYHEYPGQPLLIIIDESAGIDDSIFRAVDRCKPTYLLVTGSPLDPCGIFYDIETNANFYNHFKHFKLTQYDCLKENGWWLERKDIDDMISKWGKDHPLVKSSIFAEFASESEHSIISLASIERCINNPPTIDEYNEFYNVRRLFGDLAAGGDSNVLCLFHKGRVSIVKRWKNRDTMSCAGEILVELQKLKQRIGLEASECSFDSDGLGIGICHRLQELGWKNINLFHGNSPAKSDDFLNSVSEMWIQGCKLIEDCRIIIPNDADLRGELLSRQSKRHSNGKLKLQPKEDMKKSPDTADAVLGSLYEIGGGLVKYIKPVRINNNSGLFTYT